VSLAAEHGTLTEQEVRLGLEGNLCRCTGYHNIVRAVLAGAEAMQSQATPAGVST
jgi:carbon-monoxide dehydrogenase small subunit